MRLPCLDSRPAINPVIDRHVFGSNSAGDGRCQTGSNASQPACAANLPRTLLAPPTEPSSPHSAPSEQADGAGTTSRAASAPPHPATASVIARITAGKSSGLPNTRSAPDHLRSAGV